MNILVTKDAVESINNEIDKLEQICPESHLGSALQSYIMNQIIHLLNCYSATTKRKEDFWFDIKQMLDTLIPDVLHRDDKDEEIDPTTPPA